MAACGPKPTQKDAAVSATDASATSVKVGPDLDETERIAALETLKGMKHRPNCNRISGCPGAVALIQHREAAVPFLLEQLAAASRADGYWVYTLVDLLGQLTDVRARPALEALLRDRRWGMNARAALALARLKHPGSQQALEAAHAHATLKKDGPLQAMTAHGLALIQPSQRRRYHAEIAALIPTDAKTQLAMPPIILDVLVEAVREAQVPAALPGVRLATLSGNRFVRAQALDTIAALRDTGGLPYAYANLSHELPSIRRRAMHALQRITGAKTLVDAASWKAWCGQHGCLTLPKPQPNPVPN